MGQELSGQSGELLEIGESFARQFVTKLDGERVQFQQGPERLDVFTLIFE